MAVGLRNALFQVLVGCCTPAAAGEGRPTAVCIAGSLQRADTAMSTEEGAPCGLPSLHGLPSFRALDRFVLEPLDADAFYFVSLDSGRLLPTSFNDYVSSSSRIQVVQVDNQTGHVSWLAKLRQGHVKNTSFLPYLLQGRNTRPFRNQAMNRQWAQCMQALRGIEERRGSMYRYVAFTRVDLMWFAGHPGLHLLDASKCEDRPTVWALDAHEHLGLSDRYFIMERAGAWIMERFVDILNSFDMLEGVNRFARERTSPSASAPLNYERFLLQTMQFAGICVRHMTSVASAGYFFCHFASIWHQAGTWEASTRAYLRVAHCGHVPKACCRRDTLDFGGDLWCSHGLWRRHGQCRRYQGKLGLPKYPGDWVVERKQKDNDRMCWGAFDFVRHCCQQPHVSIQLRPSKAQLHAWAEQRQMDGLDPGIQTENPNATWHCFHWPEHTNVTRVPWHSIATSQCYDLNMLL